MKTLLIACGNPLRGDDGIAHAVLAMLRRPADSRRVQQLTPESASDLAEFDCVIFLDADASVASCTIERAATADSFARLTHEASPAEIIHLARVLFHFSGDGFVCRIPAVDFSFREGLCPQAEAAALEAARQLEFFLLEQRAAAGE
ncbi:MAG TPA: hypothetical protein VHB50_19890 [Bryobacteraceae bacterium]|nr:hypothetical protein [Bryobacteraceae bacterium]